MNFIIFCPLTDSKKTPTTTLHSNITRNNPASKSILPVIQVDKALIFPQLSKSTKHYLIVNKALPHR